MRENEYTASEDRKVYVRKELVTMIALEPDGVVLLTMKQEDGGAPEEVRLTFADADEAEAWIREHFADRLLDES